MKKLILFLLIASTIGAVGVAYAKANQARDAGLRADSLEAAADTARRVSLNLADSINAWERRVLQVELQRDSLDQELDARPVVRVAAGIQIDTVRVLDTVQVIQEDTVETYAWEGEDGPFRVSGDARIFPTGRGLFDTRVTLLAPVEIGVRVVCGSGSPVRPASVLLTAPDPFSVIPGRVEQNPAVCNPPILPVFKFTKQRLIWAAVSFGAGWLASDIFDGGNGRDPDC